MQEMKMRHERTGYSGAKQQRKYSTKEFRMPPEDRWWRVRPLLEAHLAPGTALALVALTWAVAWLYGCARWGW